MDEKPLMISLFNNSEKLVQILLEFSQQIVEGYKFVGPFTLVKTAVFKFAVFCLTIYTCPKNRELSAGTKLRDFLDRYCACPNISYFSFD